MDSENAVARPAYWEGVAQLFDGREAKSRPTPVAIGPDGLEIRDGEAAGRYRRGDLSLLDQGEDGAFFSLALKPFPGFVLAFDNPQALEWLRSSSLLGRPAFSGMSLAGKAAALIALLATFTAFMYWAGLDLAVDAAVKMLPRTADRVLGNTVIEGFTDGAIVSQDRAVLSALEKSRTLVQSAGNPEDSIRIHLVADTSIRNAFAFPGGHIVVYTGMLRLLETQEEWMGLLAHEGAHIHFRHGMRRIVRGSILAVGAALILGDVSGLASVLVDNAGALVNLGYGRRDESEADAFARRSLSAGGYRTDGLANLLEKVLTLEHLPAWAAFLSSHPATQDRIRALRERGALDTDAGSALLTSEEWTALKRL